MSANIRDPARAPRDQAFISDLEQHAEDRVDLLEDLPKD